MDREHIFGFLLALAAIAAGVVLMAAPSYFGFSPEAAPIWFYGGLIATFLLFASAIAVSVGWDFGRLKRMWPQFMLLVGAFLFTFGVYFYVQHVANRDRSDEGDLASKYILDLVGSHSQGVSGKSVSFGVRIRNVSPNRFLVYQVGNNWKLPSGSSLFRTTSMPDPLELGPGREDTVLGPGFDLGTANHIVEVGMDTYDPLRVRWRTNDVGA